MLITGANEHRESVIKLLDSAKLPAQDLPVSLDSFFVAIEHDEVIGAAGLEIYGNYGLLRSLVVLPGYQDQGIAGRLVAKVEDFAGQNNLKAVYLLTETAFGYFNRKGYEKIIREDVPVPVQASTEFSHVCPVSAIVMKKELI